MTKIRIMLQITIVTAAALIGSPAAQAGKGEITIGLNNWSENIAVSNMWKILLEERGYDVTLTSAGKAVIYSGVAGGSLDMGLEVWMPKTDKEFYERFQDNLELHDAWYRGTGLGLVVPDYVDVDSINGLNAHKGEFVRNGKPSIVGIDPGSALMGLTEKAIRKYDLDFKLIGSSGPGMTAALDRAITRKKPVVVTLWNPHWAFADYDLKYLDDPMGVYGKGENILWMTRPDFGRKHPKVLEWMNAWEMNDQQVGSLMGTIRESKTAHAGAKKWIDAHRDLVVDRKSVV